MDNTFEGNERLYRAVYPPSQRNMFWKKNGKLSPAAFADRNGLSVERGFYRECEDVITNMRRRFTGCIVSVSVQNCRDTEAVVKYLPTPNSDYHSEIHGSDQEKLLDKKQRYYLSQVANLEHFED